MNGKMNHVMLDLETFGNDFNSIIVQIGAWYFNEQGKLGKKLCINVDSEDCEKYGLNCTASTVKWWLQQDNETIKKLFENPKPLKDSLIILLDFLKDADYIWQHSSFDAPILNNAIKKVGLVNSIHYRTWKDLRSAEYCLGIDKSKFSFVGKAHYSIDDCLFQIKYLVSGLKRKVKSNDKQRNKKNLRK